MVTASTKLKHASSLDKRVVQKRKVEFVLEGQEVIGGECYKVLEMVNMRDVLGIQNISVWLEYKMLENF